MIALIPFERYIGGVYFPPALLVGMLGFVLALVAAQLLNRLRLSRFFWHPPLAFLAMWALISALIALCLIAP